MSDNPLPPAIIQESGPSENWSGDQQQAPANYYYWATVPPPPPPQQVQYYSTMTTPATPGAPSYQVALATGVVRLLSCSPSHLFFCGLAKIETCALVML